MGQEPHNRKKTTIRKAFESKVRMLRFEREMTQEELAKKGDLHHHLQPQPQSCKSSRNAAVF